MRYQRIDDNELMMEILTDEFNFEKVRYPKKFTWKAFQKFDMIKQQILCERYNIILTGYLTKGEKARKIMKKFTIKNLNKGITKFNKGMDQFNKMIAVPETKQPKRKPKRSKSRKARPQKETNQIKLWGDDLKQDKYIKELLG